MELLRRPIRDPDVIHRMRATFDLYETAQIMMRQNLRRRYPDLDDEEINRRLEAWRRRRPGAEHGDGVGRPVLRDEIEAWLTSRRS